MAAARRPGRYLTADGAAGIGVDNVWAANGSNEIMLQLLQAFGGPGRTVLSFAPTYSMYPEYARDTHTAWVAGRRAEDFTIDAAHALGTAGRAPARRRPARVAEQPDRHRAAARRDRGDLRRRAGHGRRRRGLRGVPPRRDAERAVAAAVAPRLVVTRTMSKAFALAGGRLGYLAADPPSSTPCASCGCPITCPRCRRRWRGSRWPTPTNCWRGWPNCASSATPPSTGCARAGCGPRTPTPTSCCSVRSPDRHAVWQRLLDRGVLIRETGPDGWLRVSIGTPEEMAAFRAALEEALQ